MLNISFHSLRQCAGCLGHFIAFYVNKLKELISFDKTKLLYVYV